MHYIKDIFEKTETQHAHNKFIRYSRGSFTGPLISIKFSKAAVKVDASFHFADELLILLADILGDKKVHAKGTLVWNKDLTQDLLKQGIKYSKVTKARGIFTYHLENEVALKSFVDSLNCYNLLITVKDATCSLVTKPKYPKPNKEITRDFCKASFPPEEKDHILKEFAFDVKGKVNKEISIRHEIDITNIEVPDVKDFELARRLAKRQGVIRRYVSIDKGEEVETVLEFSV
ncbi:MAG: hypothetical protein H6500_00285 [Candidatus Woesearchaeota archaeon]|nr:hypothetical protein [Nanoarchaeota archaeon]USN44272.1 MAG: hypothetical protein H6500_00285 [Candidatus Woesearchaeota archaeon]